MLINATFRSNKTEILSQYYVNLVNSGIPSEKILVLCLNSNKRKNFIKAIEENITALNVGKYNIYTFQGLCYNAVLDNWLLIQNGIKAENPVIVPNLCGLELSERLLLNSFGKDDFKDYFSKMNLLHQMFKRMQLIVFNGLSDFEVKRRSKIAGESFADDAMRVYNKFRLKSLKYSCFDYLRQIAMLSYICSNTNYFSEIEYLILDDADEISFAEWSFVKFLRKKLKDWCIAYDSCGSSRIGYLSAYKNIVNEIEEIFGERAETLEVKDLPSGNANNLFSNILKDKKTYLKNFSIDFSINRPDMLDVAFSNIKNLLDRGIKPSEILIVSPIADELLKSFADRFLGLDIKYEFVSGSRKLKDVAFLKDIFTILKFLHRSWGIKIEAFEFRNLFFDCLKIPMKFSKRAVSLCVDENNLVPADFSNEIFQKAYDDFLFFIENSFKEEMTFSSELLKIFEYFSEKDIEKEDLKYFNFLLKQVRSFEKAFGFLPDETRKNLILQLENSIMSDNPPSVEEISPDAIVISTPQKVVDFEIKRKYHIWLDISSDLWLMRDIGVLYNAWVFGTDFEKKTFEADDNISFSREKNARFLRKLLLCCDEKIYAYYSKYDSAGCENIGNMYKYFGESTDKPTQKKKFEIIPREDQKQVLDYSGGMAAVNAVPGAGKTTVLTALLIKLMSNGVKPSNILVLTYMESAASNIREKICQAFPDSDEIPDISTIHGLAFRIIKENDNYVKLNLSDNIEVADDNTRQKLLMESIIEVGLDYKDFSDYQSGISAVKLSPDGILPLNSQKSLKLFEQVFELYEKKLRMLSMIDYDDMLRYSAELLEKFPDVRKHYADLYHFVIEDEAQDSSELQQKLLLLLSSKYGNLLRIGDINQAITSSFTDSDPKCFKKFFDKSKKMVMKSSQRSSVQIQKLANDLIDYSKTQKYLKDAFFDSKLIPTANNPITDKSPEFAVFDDISEEQYFVLNKIREEYKSDRKSSIGILLRNNSQIVYWRDFLVKNGLTVTVRGDILGQKVVFKVIFAFLKYLQTPFSNQKVLDLMKTFSECKIMKFSENDFVVISSLKEPFVSCKSVDFSENLSRLWWEIAFCEELTYVSLEEAALKIGLRYFTLKNEKSNIYVVSLIIKNLSNNYSSRETVLDKLSEFAKKPVGSSYRFFEGDETNDNHIGSVSLLTVHKSKGDEFDIVFMPEVNQDNYMLNVEKIKIKDSIAEQVKELRKGYKNRTIEQIKKETAEETLRLLYVGFTRAKQELYITCSKKDKFKRTKTPSELFGVFGKEIE
ncbi:MAG: ATP-dependent helicase [Candidatus Gastranaerophilaceae bacterium]